MDEYINKSEAVDVIVKYPYDIAGKTATAIKMIEDLPSADVVPKSTLEISQHLLKEAWKRIEELDKLCGELQRKYDLAVAEREANVKGFTEELEKAKSEVERLQEEANRYKRYFFRHDYDEMIAEVLDKLDRFINSNCIEIKDERGIKGYVTSGVHFAIAELKKKYTEGEDKPASEEKHFSPEDVRKMTPQEVREKYTAIRRSMERW